MSQDLFSSSQPPQGHRQLGQSPNLHRQQQQHSPPVSIASRSTNLPPTIGGDEDAMNSSGTKSPLQLGLGFLKDLSSKDKKNRDGQPAKRRGPKPDSKPALTRRQELNRQAQRTHRERKESYIRWLEQQVMQLKEHFTGSVQERDAIAEENQKLKDLLTMHGIAFQSRCGTTTYAPDQTLNAPASTGYAFQGSSSFSPQSQPMSSQSVSPGPYLDETSLTTQQAQPQGLDYDQLSVDFVLASVSQQQGHADPRAYSQPFNPQFQNHPQ